MDVPPFHPKLPLDAKFNGAGIEPMFLGQYALGQRFFRILGQNRHRRL